MLWIVLQISRRKFSSFLFIIYWSKGSFILQQFKFFFASRLKLGLAVTFRPLNKEQYLLVAILSLQYMYAPSNLHLTG
jgi:hypothetical protein